jgi:UDP-2,3-diacylglucosamine hydrolase
VQRAFRALPEVLRRRIAGAARSRSRADQRMKPAAIMDVNAGAIEAAFRAHGVSRIIHGHTHRPAQHRLRIDGRDCERIVLADWRPEHCEYLAVDAGGIRRLVLPT